MKTRNTESLHDGVISLDTEVNDAVITMEVDKVPHLQLQVHLSPPVSCRIPLDPE